jgi:hypothetical protein
MRKSSSAPSQLFRREATRLATAVGDAVAVRIPNQSFTWREVIRHHFFAPIQPPAVFTTDASGGYWRPGTRAGSCFSVI